MFDFYLDGKCSEEKYNQKLTAIKQERLELEQKLTENELDTKEDVENMNNLVDIVGSIRKVMNCSTNTKKRELLNLLLSNAQLNGTNLCFDLKKPFDKILFSKGCNLWWEAYCAIRAENKQEFTDLMQQVKKFKEKWLISPTGEN